MRTSELHVGEGMQGASQTNEQSEERQELSETSKLCEGRQGSLGTNEQNGKRQETSETGELG